MPAIAYYNKAGVRVPGTTTIIGGNLGWNKRALMHWAWNEGMEGRNYRETADAAADAGTIAHAMIEADLKGQDWRDAVDSRKVTPEAESLALTACEAWQEWRETVQFALLGSEVSLVSEVHQYGGTIDVAAIKRKTAIVDLKTSNGVYQDHLIQLAAYGQLWDEHHPDNPIGAYYLLRLGKNDGSFHYHYWPQLKAAREAFNYLRQIHNLKKKIAV